MKRCLTICTLIGSLTMYAGAEAVISRMNASQRPGTKLVDITFDVTSSSANEVALFIRIQRQRIYFGSTNYSEMVSPSVAGDVGAGVPTGSGKAIVWDMEADWDQHTSTFLFTVTADDGNRRPYGGDPNALTWEVVNERWVKNLYTYEDATMTDLSGTNMWLYDADSVGEMGPVSSAEYCRNLYYAGYRDWELPTLTPLRNLYSQKHLFYNVQDDMYCSDTSTFLYAWYVDMTDGSVWPITGGLFGSVPPGHVWPRRTYQRFPLRDVATDTCEIDSYNKTLTVISEHGPAFPAVGSHTNYCWYAHVPCSVDPWVREGGTNFVCTGFTQTTGINSPSLPCNYDTLILKRSASITWHWAVSDYQIEVSVEGGGTVTPGTGWYPADTNLNLSATPAPGWFFSGWSGDWSGNQAASNTVLLVNGYKHITARFSNDWDENGLPDNWEQEYAVDDASADNDRDGFNNLAEYVSGTDPTNAASFFHISGWPSAVGGFVVSWEPCLSNRLYRIFCSTNLPGEFQALGSGIEFPENSVTDTVHSGENQCFYQVEVGLK